MKQKNKIVILFCLIGIGLTFGASFVNFNNIDITEGHYYVSPGVEVSGIGDYTSMDVLEVDNTVALLHSPEDELNYIGNIEVNKSKIFNINKFEERTPIITFEIYFSDYSIRTLDYKISSDCTIDIVLSDVNITINSNSKYHFWVSAKEATNQARSFIIFVGLGISFVPTALIIGCIVDNSIGEQNERDS
ncbi:MAG: hypothetical protein ACW98D_18875 [Promethearchaeota archaeon]